mgnify:CR=1 FL=1|jgi:hypothetical protein
MTAETPRTPTDEEIDAAVDRGIAAGDFFVIDPADPGQLDRLIAQLGL